MRLALVALLVPLAGCPRQSDGVCDEDVDCDAPLVCARGDHLCVSESEVRFTRTEWTINGAPASIATCVGVTLYIQFQSDLFEDDFGFAPVPCETGVFTVDKLPVRYRAVELGVDGGGPRDRASFDADGVALLDLAL